MKLIGAHVSIAGGLENAPKAARQLGANAFGLFTKNQRQWAAKPLTEEEILRFKERCRALGFPPQSILAHDSYLINLGHPEPNGLEKSRNAFTEEMSRCQQLGIAFLNFHPGSHKNEISEAECLNRIAESINQALDNTSDVTAVIEITAGQGSGVGHRFEQIAAILEKVRDQTRTGVCFDTCHAFAAGYDLRTPEACTYTFGEFDRLIGLSRLRGMHLNDARSGLASRVDRHHSLGQGEIGLDAFRWIMQNSAFDGIPLILETIDEEIWPQEIRMLRDFSDETQGKGILSSTAE